MAPRTGLLQPTKTKAQINSGLSLWLDEKRGSRHAFSIFDGVLGPGAILLACETTLGHRKFFGSRALDVPEVTGLFFKNSAQWR